MKQINYEAEHRKLWNWLADHPEKEKEDYFENWSHNSIPHNECFACEVACQAADLANVNGMCWFCPITDIHTTGCCGYLFARWLCASNTEERQMCARKIAGLPWKEKEMEV